MSEIAKCPMCGKAVKKSIWRPEYEGCSGNVVITVKCCGIEASSIGLWNQYAAAMELAKATVVVYDASDAEDILGCAIRYHRAAHDRVLEVFK